MHYFNLTSWKVAKLLFCSVSFTLRGGVGCSRGVYYQFMGHLLDTELEQFKCAIFVN